MMDKPLVNAQHPKIPMSIFKFHGIKQHYLSDFGVINGNHLITGYVKFDMKKLRLMTRIIFILVVCFLVGLSPIWVYSSEKSPEISQRQFDESKPNIHFTDPEKQEKFVSWLTEEGIPFKIEKLDNTANEYVTWDKEHDVKVQEMRWNIQEEVPNISFPTKEQDEYFMSLLQKEKISFRVVQRHTSSGPKQTIEYRAEDANKVRKLIIEVLKKAGT